MYERVCAGRSRLGWLLAAAGCLTMADLPAIAADTLPSETPGRLRRARRQLRLREARSHDSPMRDGVKLQTLILIPRGAHRAPILLTRTPYGATGRITKGRSTHLSALIDNTDVADDARRQRRLYSGDAGTSRASTGPRAATSWTRPLRGPLNPTDIDHSTITYDTIDWLIKNIPESNGKVGILGISYDGFTSLMALVNPHPALRAAVPINAMVDGWRGDDWFHNGAFRLDSLTYFHDQEATRDSSLAWWTDHYDDYDTWLSAGSAGDMARLHALETSGVHRQDHEPSCL